MGPRANLYSTPGSSVCNGVDVDLEYQATSLTHQEYGLACPYPKGGPKGRESTVDELQLDEIATRGYIWREEEIGDGPHPAINGKRRGDLNETEKPTKSNTGRIDDGSNISAFTENNDEDDYDHGESFHARNGLADSEISLRRDYTNEVLR